MLSCVLQQFCVIMSQADFVVAVAPHRCYIARSSHTCGLACGGTTQIGVIVIVVWTAFWSFLAFSVLRRYSLLRVSDDAIDEGLDIVDHGESAYVFTAIARDSQRPWGPIDMRMKGMHNGNSTLPVGNDLRRRRRRSQNASSSVNPHAPSVASGQDHESTTDPVDTTLPTAADGHSHNPSAAPTHTTETSV
eukprot:m.516964 g.516964  ORF g.516964 m.516964 type:complete len:191 (+) comp21934_c0_seq3:1437-2009(+)